jgi:hypothetical protein
MSRRDRYDDHAGEDRPPDYRSPNRPRRRRRRRGSPAVALLIIAAVLAAVLGTAVALVALVAVVPNRDWRGGKTFTTSGPADQLIDRLVGEWGGQDLDGGVTFRFRKDHTATLVTQRQVVQFTWELESAAEGVLVIRTESESGTGRSRFVFLSTDEVQLESLKVNKAIVFTRNR